MSDGYTVGETFRAILLLDLYVMIGISGIFSLIMLGLLMFGGVMSVNNWIFDSLDKLFNPAQRPEPATVTAPETEQKQLAVAHSMKEYMSGSFGVWSLATAYNLQGEYPITDLNKEVEDLLIKFWDLHGLMYQHKKPLYEKLKSQGITNFIMQEKIIKELMLNNQTTKSKQEQFDSLINQLKEKVQGGEAS